MSGSNRCLRRRDLVPGPVSGSLRVLTQDTSRQVRVEVYDGPILRSDPILLLSHLRSHVTSTRSRINMHESGRKTAVAVFCWAELAFSDWGKLKGKVGPSPAPGKQSGGIKYLNCAVGWSNLGAVTTTTRLSLTLLSCDVYQRKKNGGVYP